MSYRDARRKQAHLRDQWGRRISTSSDSGRHARVPSSTPGGGFGDPTAPPSSARARLPLVFSRQGRRPVDMRRAGDAFLGAVLWGLLAVAVAAVGWSIMYVVLLLLVAR